MEQIISTLLPILGKIGFAILGAGGLWKGIELFANFRENRMVKTAHIRNLQTQSQSHIIQTQLQWSDRLEARVKELEKEARNNEVLIAQVASLRGEVKSLKAENKSLRKQLKKLIAQNEK